MASKLIAMASSLEAMASTLMASETCQRTNKHLSECLFFVDLFSLWRAALVATGAKGGLDRLVWLTSRRFALCLVTFSFIYAL